MAPVAALRPPRAGPYLSSPEDPTWKDPRTDEPHPGVLVSVRVKGQVRPNYYRIGDRWYSLDDLDRWRMNTSRYWEADRSWYLETYQIDLWR